MWTYVVKEGFVPERVRRNCGSVRKIRPSHRAYVHLGVGLGSAADGMAERSSLKGMGKGDVDSKIELEE